MEPNNNNSNSNNSNSNSSNSNSNSNTINNSPTALGSMPERTRAKRKNGTGTGTGTGTVSSRQRFHNRLSFALTATTFLLLGVLSLFFGTTHDSGAPSSSSALRWLEDAGNNDDNNDDNSNNNDDNNNNGDYSNYSCQYIYDEISEDDRQNLCSFARTCNDGEGVWTPWIFCSSSLGTYAAFAVLSPFLVVWMVTLFRLLGSTAEDFFSCSLEMFSLKLGLPPRFAGVTLLALGNGAADVSATVSAIVSDAENGYKLSLGALTGAAMLVGGVVSGVVVLVAGRNGNNNGHDYGVVKCRGALIRDVSALAVTVVVVWNNLSSGVVTRSDTTLFYGLYVSFVSSVLAADVYHRAVVVPRLEAIARAVGDAEGAAAATGSAGGATGSATGSAAGEGLAQPPPPNAFMRIVTSISNYDNDNGCVGAAAGTGTAAAGTGTTSATTMPSIAMTDTTTTTAVIATIEEEPIVLHGQHGILSPSRVASTRAGGTVIGGGAGAGGFGVGGSALELDVNDGGGMYTLVEDHIDRVCVGAGSPGTPSYNWIGAWQDGKREISVEVAALWEQIVTGGDGDGNDGNGNGGFDEDVDAYGYDEGDRLKMYERCLLLFEFPFILVRKATIPIPCEGYYNRGFVALSVALSPLWFSYYLLAQHGINLWSKELLPSFLVYWAVSAAIGVLVLRFAPGGDGTMSLLVATPIALYGFVVAATWIDWIADRLVSVLNFTGIVLRIPGSVMGLTVLAWGNSVGDLSANITMARKGLANMAMTACFAGPVFNILLGLGLGFRTLEARTAGNDNGNDNGNGGAVVTLPAPILAGFCFVLLNCATILVMGLLIGKRGRIETSYGYVAVALYAIYIVTSITLEFRS